MSEFEKFMQNTYWRELYENASENVKKKYYKLQWSPDLLKEWTNKELIEDKNNLTQLKILFSKEDWKCVIKHSTGRERSFLIKDMNKKFLPIENL